jgi:hypothetical protein
MYPGIGGYYTERNFTNCTLYQILWDDEIKEDEMSGACRYMGQVKNAYTMSIG